MPDTALEVAKQAMKAELRQKMRTMATVLVSPDHVTVLRLRDDCFVETRTPLKGSSDA